jgi:heme-degrading monooxygenase HmoA
MKPSRFVRATVIAALGALSVAASAEPVILINVYEVPPGEEEAAIRYWEGARDFLARQPGYRNTRPHQALSPQARFLLINVAEWDSAQAFQAAVRAMQGAPIGAAPEGLKFTPALYRVVRE